MNNDLNLDPFLFPKDSPYAQNQGATSGYAFDYQNEAGIISSAKIRNAAIGNAQIGTAAIGSANIQVGAIGSAQIGTLSFNQISGGTALLGGTTNGNGLLSVLNSGGSEVVRADNTGLTVTNGSVVIQNSGGTNIIDSLGLNGLAVFQSSGSIHQTQQTVMGTADGYHDLPDPSMSIVLARTSKVLCMATAWVQHNTSGQQATMRMYIGEGTIPLALIDDTHKTLSIFGVYSLNAGTHTFKLQMENVSPAPDEAVDFTNVSMAYVVLGN